MPTNLSLRGKESLSTENIIAILMRHENSSPLITLDLYQTSLGSRSTKDLTALCAALPLPLKHLILSYNQFGKNPSTGLAQALRAIKAKLETLRLAYNDLDELSLAEWIKILEAMPNTVITLDLAFSIYKSEPQDEKADAKHTRLEECKKILTKIEPKDSHAIQLETNIKQDQTNIAQMPLLKII